MPQHLVGESGAFGEDDDVADVDDEREQTRHEHVAGSLGGEVVLEEARVRVPVVEEEGEGEHAEGGEGGCLEQKLQRRAACVGEEHPCDEVGEDGGEDSEEGEEEALGVDVEVGDHRDRDPHAQRHQRPRRRVAHALPQHKVLEDGGDGDAAQLRQLPGADRVVGEAEVHEANRRGVQQRLRHHQRQRRPLELEHAEREEDLQRHRRERKVQPRERHKVVEFMLSLDVFIHRDHPDHGDDV
mmetsp:Transcript_24865/g.59059  ORF Transcript_24865/g.59059 Transcript_24865/m.59059 type:complete len:241 (+) Transcript_24865:447-1169(+)